MRSLLSISWLRFLLLAEGLVGLLPPVWGQSVIYLTNGDASSLQAIDVTARDVITGNAPILFSANTAFRGYPLAVRSSIWIDDISNTPKAFEFNLTDGTPTGAFATLTGPTDGQFLDGAASETNNFTLGWNGSGAVNVYETDSDWSSPVKIFTTNSALMGSDIMGIAYDTSSGNLWLNNDTTIYEVTLTGTILSQFSHTNERGSLAYQASTDTLWFVPNGSTAPLLQYSKTGDLLLSLVTDTRSSNIWGAEFSTIPEPATVALLGLGALILSFIHLRRRAFSPRE